jgi:hypothetical protein
MEDRSAMMRDDRAYCPLFAERHHFLLSLELSALSYIRFNSINLINPINSINSINKQTPPPAPC